MALRDQVENDLRGAMKSRDDVVLRTLRMLKAALDTAAIAKRPQALTEPEEIRVVRTELKRRQEAIGEYQRGGRSDLADRESAEAAVLQQYLPAAVDPTVLRAAVATVVKRLGATGPKDFGKVMGAAMKELGANADGTAVSAMVKELLNQDVEAGSRKQEVGKGP